jgi:tol-pal system protein YbgF
MRVRTLLLVLPFAVAAASGCARTAEERQLDAMRDEIDRIQNDRDRISESDLDERPVPARTSAPPSNPGASMAYSLSTNEAMTPAADDDGDGYADPEDTSPRPRIRVVGAARAAHGRPGEDRVEEVAPDDGASTPLDPDAKRAYDAALSLVNAKQFGPALDALAAFLVKWPDHPYADHAMYWRGECYFAQGDSAHAAEQFEGVVARFPAGMKAPDALLKLGMTYQKLGQAAQSRASFDRLLRDYPQSDAARRVPAPTTEDRP